MTLTVHNHSRVFMNPRSLTPMCNTCGWRMGGLDSWDGRACKCGNVASPMPDMYEDGCIVEGREVDFNENK